MLSFGQKKIAKEECYGAKKKKKGKRNRKRKSKKNWNVNNIVISKLIEAKSI